jgi:hypothetical protein
MVAATPWSGHSLHVLRAVMQKLLERIDGAPLD